jgi:hypothetical protein
MEDQKFAGAVRVASENGRSIVIATVGEEIKLIVPPDVRNNLGAHYFLSEEEAWCLAQQLLLACRRAARSR